MSNGGRRYISYLLRLWQAESDGVVVWRTSLQDPHTGRRRGFADLEDLFAFLLGKIGLPTGSETGTRISPEHEIEGRQPE